MSFDKAYNRSGYAEVNRGTCDMCNENMLCLFTDSSQDVEWHGDTPVPKGEPYDPAKKAINKNEGKHRWSLLLTDFQPELEQVLKARQMGAEKYGRDNPFKPQDKQFKEDNLDSIERHLMAIRSDQDLDDESGLSHLAHIALRALIGLSGER